ncbi:MAG: outer membrane beta-barrel protein [Nitrospira sp.]|nr:outer membrane beta-barrel protein [Nitrospira sp.]
MTVVRLIIVTLVFGVLLIGNRSWAQEAQGPERSEVNAAHEIYAGLYLFGALTNNRPLTLGGDSLEGTTVGNGFGGGFRAGIFPAFTNYVVGVQADTFGMGSQLSASSTSGSGEVRSARATLLAGNTLVSLVVRYPGVQFQPYLGAGMGMSSALLVGIEMIKGSTAQAGTASATAFAYQYFAGLRTHLTPRIFMFGEYKWFGARYAWNGNLTPSLDYRTHLMTVGVGSVF